MLRLRVRLRMSWGFRAVLGFYARAGLGRFLVRRRDVMRRLRVRRRIHRRPGVHLRTWRRSRRMVLMTRVGRRGVNMSAASRSIRAIARGLRAAEAYATSIGLRALTWVQVAYCLARGRARTRPRPGR
jgi:hypothetical protein